MLPIYSLGPDFTHLSPGPDLIILVRILSILSPGLDFIMVVRIVGLSPYFIHF